MFAMPRASQQYVRHIKRWRHILHFVLENGLPEGRKTPARPFCLRPLEAVRYGRFFEHVVAPVSYHFQSAFLWKVRLYSRSGAR